MPSLREYTALFGLTLERAAPAARARARHAPRSDEPGRRDRRRGGRPAQRRHHRARSPTAWPCAWPSCTGCWARACSSAMPMAEVATRDVVLRGGTRGRRHRVARAPTCSCRAGASWPSVSSSTRRTAPTVLDCGGCVVAPGLVDLHTHLRQPGREEAETVETGSRAAALGGFTAVVAMPNTEPAIDSAGVVREVQELGRLAGAVRRPRRGRHHRRAGRASAWRRWPRWPPSACASSPTTATACRTPG